MQTDSAECEAWARAGAGSAGDSTAGGAVGGAVTGAAVGAALGAIAGAFVGAADSGAAIGAALGGASGGMQGAAGGAVAYDQRLVMAYQNCMVARGYVVNGMMVEAAPVEESAMTGPDAEYSDVEERLLRLRSLYDAGLISDREHRDRRRAVLADL
jgi:hypothetical protein